VIAAAQATYDKRDFHRYIPVTETSKSLITSHLPAYNSTRVTQE